LVQYNPPSGWIREGKAPEFDVTTHASPTPGDTAELTFQGTSISVYGSLAGGNGQSQMNFTIDGAMSGSYQTPQTPRPHGVHNSLFFTSAALEEASHTLTITVDQDPSNPNATIFLDYFVYTTASPAGRTMLIDDSNTNLTYSPDWQTINDCDNCLEGTQHISESPGAWVAFTFEGTQISLNDPSGSPPDGFEASVAIDEFPPAAIHSTGKNQLFSSHELNSGTHTMNITVLNGNSFAIDYFLVTSNLAVPTSPVADSPPPSSLTLPSASTLASEITSATPVPSAASLAGAQTTKAPPIAAIVGGAVGGLAFLLLLLLVLLMWRRRARRSNQPDFEYPEMFSTQPWPIQQTANRGSVGSMRTLTEGEEERPKNFGKSRPPSRYIYYE